MASSDPVDKENENTNKLTLTSLKNLAIHDESLIEQVEGVKKELEEHFQHYHDILYHKHQQIVSQLDAILVSANDLYMKRSELRETQRDLEEKVRSNQFNVMKNKMQEVLLAEMSELERSISRSEREKVEVMWKDSQLEAAIGQVCVVSKRDTIFRDTPVTNTIQYKDREVPVWSVASAGTGDGQVMSAEGLCVDLENDDIYIADMDNDRIVIFNRDGLFQRNLKIDTVTRPFTVLIIKGYCFVACDVPSESLIVKLDKKNGDIQATLKPDILLTAITLDQETAMLFGSPLNEASIWFIDQDSLNNITTITLESEHYTSGITRIHCIQTCREEIFVLFFNSPSPLQSFTREGKPVRDIIIPADLLGRADFFVIDSQKNIIISEESAHLIKIFSYKGELIASIGKDATDKCEPGELYSPRGIALTTNGNIVVCDAKPENLLQMY